MTLTQIIVLALIQGITEFLPVSSSAHLIIPGQLLHWQDQGIAFDVAVHFGTLLAVVIYYISDLLQITKATTASIFSRKQTELSRIGWFIVLATIPAAIAGLLLEDFISSTARSIHVIAYTTIGFGLLLGVASLFNKRHFQRFNSSMERENHESLKKLTLMQALTIGCAQAFAIIPGTSRSGITLTAGLFLKIRPEAAARFSFLLSIPIILASALLESIKIIKDGNVNVSMLEMGIGVGLSFITAILVIHMFMKFIAKSGMAVFVIYRVLLGIFLLYMTGSL